MRFLRVNTARRQCVEACADGWDAQKFEIALRRAVLLVDKLRGLEEGHVHDMYLQTFYRVAQHTDALDLSFHDIASLEEFGWVAREADAAGCACGNNVPSFKRHALGEDGNDAANVKEHVGGGVFLFGDAIYAQV